MSPRLVLLPCCNQLFEVIRATPSESPAAIVAQHTHVYPPLSSWLCPLQQGGRNFHTRDCSPSACWPGRGTCVCRLPPWPQRLSLGLAAARRRSLRAPAGWLQPVAGWLLAGALAAAWPAACACCHAMQLAALQPAARILLSRDTAVFE